MRYKPRSVAAPQVALGGLSDAMHVEVERESACPQKPSRNFANVTAWPENLVITAPPERPESAIKVSRAGRAKSLSPKP
jgi:hypothetical protein